MEEFAGYKKLGKKVKVDPVENQLVKIGKKDLMIQNATAASAGLKITIATDEDVMLDGVSVETKNGPVPLSTTLEQTEVQQKDGRMMKARTLLFDTKAEPEELVIEGMHYNKRYDKKIVIPVK